MVDSVTIVIDHVTGVHYSPVGLSPTLFSTRYSDEFNQTSGTFCESREYERMKCTIQQL